MTWLFVIITQNLGRIEVAIVVSPYSGTEMIVVNGIDKRFDTGFSEKWIIYNQRGIGKTFPTDLQWEVLPRHSRQFVHAYVVMCALVGISETLQLSSRLMMLLVAMSPHSALMQHNVVSCRISMNHDMGSQRSCAFPPETVSMTLTVLHQQVIPFTISHIRLIKLT